MAREKRKLEIGQKWALKYVFGRNEAGRRNYGVRPRRSILKFSVESVWRVGFGRKRPSPLYHLREKNYGVTAAIGTRRDTEIFRRICLAGSALLPETAKKLEFGKVQKSVKTGKTYFGIIFLCLYLLC